MKTKVSQLGLVAKWTAHIPRRSLRRAALVMHRWVGLSLAVFLFMAGVTGSVLVFQHEIDAWINPDLYQVQARPRSMVGSPFDLQTAVLEGVPGAEISTIYLDTPAGGPQRYWAHVPATPLRDAHFREFFVDPHTTSLLGSRQWGSLEDGRRSMMSVIYRFHQSLALERIGQVLLGIVALLWALDCFVGAYLTFPSARSRNCSAGVVSWMGRWRHAWLVRTGRLFSTIFTWHRASGLWVWGLLFMIAWSGVAFNLGPEVYKPVMSTVFEFEEPDLPQLEAPRLQPKLAFASAYQKAHIAMEAAAGRRGFKYIEPSMISYRPGVGAYVLRVRSDLDVSDRYPRTSVWIDGHTGETLELEVPTGQALGNTITTWFYNLHMGTVAALGWPYRLVLALTGLLVAGLSLSGIWIWQVKSRRRRRQQTNS